MKIQIQGVHVPKHLQANATHGLLSHPPEYRVAQLTEKYICKAGAAIGQHQPGQRRGRDLLQRLPVHGIHQIFQQKGYGENCSLGQQQAQQCQQYPVA